MYDRWRTTRPNAPIFDNLYADARESELADADAALSVVLEEAAKVAEAFPARTHGNLATAPYAAAEQAGDEIAAAIRAMMGKD
jgi:hypothetical protein